MTRHFTSREFNQDLAAAKRAARAGPVFISDRGKGAFVLLSRAEYDRIADRKGTLLDLLSWRGTEDIDLDALIGERTVDPSPLTFDDNDR